MKTSRIDIIGQNGNDGGHYLLSKEALQMLDSFEPFTPPPSRPDPLFQGGLKYDGDKLHYNLIPPELLEELAKVLTYGANKYAPRNWEKGISRDRLFAALQRHLWSYWGGERVDVESGLDHLSHAACCIAFLITLHKRGFYDE